MIRSAWIALALAAAAWGQAGARAAEFAGEFEEAVSNVFADDRIPVTRVQGPSQWIGRLLLPGGAWCTAGLVHRDLILTAAHCLLDPKTRQLSKGPYVFQYGVLSGKATASSSVTWMTWGSLDVDKERRSDWAILRLARPLGARYGWMGVRSLPFEAFRAGLAVSFTGFGGDYYAGRVASYEASCFFTGEMSSKGVLLHNCNTSRGTSGGPMYRAERGPDGRITYMVVALNVAERRDGGDTSLVNIPYTHKHANIALPASEFLPTLMRLIAQSP